MAFLDLSKCFRLVRLNLHDEDENHMARPAAAVADVDDTVVWWPAWVFDHYNQLSSVARQYQLTGTHFPEFVAQSARDPTILRRRVAYLIGAEIPGNRRTVYHPLQTIQMEDATPLMLDQGRQIPGWLQAVAEGSLRSNHAAPPPPPAAAAAAAVPQPSLRTARGGARAPNLAEQAARGGVARRGNNGVARRRASPPKVAASPAARARGSLKAAPVPAAVPSSDTPSLRARKPNPSTSPMAARKSDSNENPNDGIKRKAVVGYDPSKALTERQTKKQKGEPETEQERDFYRFSKLWKNILVKEGWTRTKPPPQRPRVLQLDTMWYAAPWCSSSSGEESSSSILGRDYFSTAEDVIEYCKQQGYFAKYYGKRGRWKVKKLTTAPYTSEPNTPSSQQQETTLNPTEQPEEDDEDDDDEKDDDDDDEETDDDSEKKPAAATKTPPTESEKPGP